MKVSATALSFLILAATLRYPAHGSLDHESWDDEPSMVMHQWDPRGSSPGIHRPSDCCQSYTQRKIRCRFMESYFVKTSGCSQPAVIFTTKRGKRVCANPDNAEVQDCVMNLNRIQLELLSKLLTDKQGY